MKLFDSKILQASMLKILSEKQVEKQAAEHVVNSLIQTSLRAVDSHGINLFPHYCRAIDSGRINKTPQIKINQTSTGTATMDANHAFGHHAGAVAIDFAVEKAKNDSGIFAINVQNSTHFGAAAYFGLRAAEQNCIGLAFTNADALVKAHASTEAFFGTNPICFTAPVEGEEPFCLDMATSFANWNKINNYRRTNENLPPDWAFNEHGEMVTDPHKARSLAPAGQYKGYGLGMMVDILCAVLAGGTISKDLPAMYSSPIEQKRHISHFFIAIDIEKFIPASMFKTIMRNMIDRIRNMPQQNENEPVMVAGDPEKISYTKRIANGILIDEAKFNEFLEISPEFKKALLNS